MLAVTHTVLAWRAAAIEPAMSIHAISWPPKMLAQLVGVAGQNDLGHFHVREPRRLGR